MRLGGRLFGAEALTARREIVKQALKSTARAGHYVYGHLVAGPGPRNVRIPGGSNALLPSWRRTYPTIDFPRYWSTPDQDLRTDVPVNATQKREIAELVKRQEGGLRKLAPDMGCYMNEGNPAIEDWKKAFFGENYPRLLEIKKAWDPEGVFWCRTCVGNDMWEVVGGTAIDQDAGMLCRAE